MGVSGSGDWAEPRGLRDDKEGPGRGRGQCPRKVSVRHNLGPAGPACLAAEGLMCMAEDWDLAKPSHSLWAHCLMVR